MSQIVIVDKVHEIFSQEISLFFYIRYGSHNNHVFTPNTAWSYHYMVPLKHNVTFTHEQAFAHARIIGRSIQITC